MPGEIDLERRHECEVRISDKQVERKEALEIPDHGVGFFRRDVFGASSGEDMGDIREVRCVGFCNFIDDSSIETRG